jgi:hypothetical protein
MIGTGSERNANTSFRRAIIVAGLLPWALGCGASTKGPTGRLQGRVTYEGVPVRVGTVCVYAPELGVGGSADLGEDGGYAIPEPLRPGRYSVAILPPSEPPPEDDTAASPGKDYGNLPPMYRDPQQSGLVIDIEQGDNTLNVNMTGRGATTE